eukprot:GHVL01006904.1.p1 GENE.GHVL01006904.1~~GHVL01006904.1.p1  ORF type:complete len:670 (+),score=28.42 GHVL01006904.1:188-2197(+)
MTQLKKISLVFFLASVYILNLRQFYSVCGPGQSVEKTPVLLKQRTAFLHPAMFHVDKYAGVETRTINTLPGEHLNRCLQPESVSKPNKPLREPEWDFTIRIESNKTWTNRQHVPVRLFLVDLDDKELKQAIEGRSKWEGLIKIRVPTELRLNTWNKSTANSTVTGSNTFSFIMDRMMDTMKTTQSAFLAHLRVRFFSFSQKHSLPFTADSLIKGLFKLMAKSKLPQRPEQKDKERKKLMPECSCQCRMSDRAKSGRFMSRSCRFELEYVHICDRPAVRKLLNSMRPLGNSKRGLKLQAKSWSVDDTVNRQGQAQRNSMASKHPETISTNGQREHDSSSFWQGLLLFEMHHGETEESNEAHSRPNSQVSVTIVALLLGGRLMQWLILIVTRFLAIKMKMTMTKAPVNLKIFNLYQHLYIAPVTRFLPNVSPDDADALHHIGYRLATLAALPSSCTLSRVKLARAGFFYDLRHNSVVCHSCGISHHVECLSGNGSSTPGHRQQCPMAPSSVVPYFGNIDRPTETDVIDVYPSARSQRRVFTRTSGIPDLLAIGLYLREAFFLQPTAVQGQRRAPAIRRLSHPDYQDPEVRRESFHVQCWRVPSLVRRLSDAGFFAADQDMAFCFCCGYSICCRELVDQSDNSTFDSPLSPHTMRCPYAQALAPVQNARRSM